MYQDIQKILCCPICKSSFALEIIEAAGDEIVEGVLTCQHGHRYFVRKGVIDFCSEEQSMANRWSEAYQETDYEEFDAQIESQKSAKEKEQQQKILDFFVDELSQMKDGIIVDVASGRGMLLTKLGAHINEAVSIIATDLSFDVLMYDRLKLKKINPNLRISYIACDATNMPIEASTADAVVSFFGIANMLGIVENGIEEAARILKANGKLLNAFIVINKGSNGFAALKQVCSDNQILGAEDAYLSENVTQMHDSHFGSVVSNIIVEDVREPEENKIDLLPYPGEWFAEIVYRCNK